MTDRQVKKNVFNYLLTYQWAMFPSYKNQSIHFHIKLIDWFLYDGKIGSYWVK